MTNPEEGRGTAGLKKVWTGFKIALALMLAWPFIVVLLPLWVIHVWNERRLGRPTPHAPWSVVMQALRRTRQRTTAPPWREVLEGSAAVGAADPEEPPRPDGSGMHGGSWHTDEGTKRGVALVTEGGHALGAAIGAELARSGYAVGVIHHRDPELARSVADAIVAAGGVAVALDLDASDPQGVDAMLDRAGERLGGAIALLVQLSGPATSTPRHGGSWENLESQVRNQLLGPLWLSLQTATRMHSTGGGVILHLCDPIGERPSSGFVGWGAAGAGLRMAIRTLSRDLAPRVRVNAMVTELLLPSGNEGLEPGRVEAVLQAMRYLLDARSVTGEIMRMDGGGAGE